MRYPLNLLAPVEYWKDKVAFKVDRTNYGIWTMIAIQSGRFVYQIDQCSGTAQAGDIIFCPPNTVFYRKIIEPLSYFYCPFRYEDVELVEEQRIIQLLLQCYEYKFAPIEQERLYNTYRHLTDLFERQVPNGNYWITHYINDVWMLFCKEAEDLANRLRLPVDTQMLQAKKWIEQYAFHDVQLKDVAECLGLHQVQLSRRFHKVFGITPSKYLYSLRMEKAKLLLVQTNYTLERIAQLCGYDNGFYFSKKFTEYAQMNPSTFRKVQSYQTV